MPAKHLRHNDASGQTLVYSLSFVCYIVEVMVVVVVEGGLGGALQ